MPDHPLGRLPLRELERRTKPR